MTLAIHREEAILTLALDRPEAGNRLDGPTVSRLTEELEGAFGPGPEVDPPAVIILSSTSDDFSLGRERDPDALKNPKAITAEFEGIQRLNEAVQWCPAITIAAITGRAEGAGLSLAARCDIVVVADDARLRFPEVAHGIPPTIVLSHYRYVLPRSILGDLIYTGRALDGPEAVRFGLAARSVASAHVDEEVRAIAQQVAAFDRHTIAVVKRFLSRTESIPPIGAPALGIAMYSVEMGDRAVSS